MTIVTFFLEVIEKSHSKVDHTSRMYKLTFPSMADSLGYYFPSR